MENRQVPAGIKELQASFSKLSMMRGEMAHIATCDQNKKPNVAPIGSMRITDDGMVHVIRGGLSRTYSNVLENPEAVFSFFRPPGLKAFFRMFSDTKTVSGYRIYCRFIESVSAESVVKSETALHLRHFFFFLRKPVAGYMAKNCRQVLVFKITGVRAIVH